ncbi:MAG: M10 family metallopeptidase, partial [Alphaproteobacteria bacterium]
MYFTGFRPIDALLDVSEPHWKGEGAFGVGAKLTFSFAQFETPTTEDHFGQSSFTAAQKVAARFALQKWANVANVTFTEIPDTGDFLGNGKGRGDINFRNEAIPDINMLAYAFFPLGEKPRSNELSGDVHVNSRVKANFNEIGVHEQGLFTLMHELGHSLGLGHPNDGSVTLPAPEDNDRFSIMIDFVGKGVFADAGVFPSTPMLYDILAIQHLYGANTSFNKSNTTYTFDDDDVVYETIWDAGGKDTISVAGSTFRAIIDLRAGKFSSVVGSPDGSGAASKNLAIAFGVTIENATGGSKDDVIVGNGSSNKLKGSGGDDTLSSASGDDSLIGGTGNDTLDGGAGRDRLLGGPGDDTYVVGSNKDVIVESTGGGVDNILSTISRTLDAHVENMTLLGNGNLNAIGNTLANSITGNSGQNAIQSREGDDVLAGGAGNDSLLGGSGNDTLDGGAGSDKLVGGTGNDTYRLGNANDRIDELPGQGIDTVLSSVTYKLSSDVENLTLTGAGAVSGTGNDESNDIRGNSGANLLRGMGGNDTLSGGTGNDQLIGGDGD